MVSDGVFERFPRLKFVMTELGGAWVGPTQDRVLALIDELETTEMYLTLFYAVIDPPGRIDVDAFVFVVRPDCERGGRLAPDDLNDIAFVQAQFGHQPRRQPGTAATMLGGRKIGDRRAGGDACVRDLPRRAGRAADLCGPGVTADAGRHSVRRVRARDRGGALPGTTRGITHRQTSKNKNKNERLP